MRIYLATFYGERGSNKGLTKLGFRKRLISYWEIKQLKAQEQMRPYVQTGLNKANRKHRDL